MKSKIGDKERLRHIRDFCVDIEKAMGQYDEDEFDKDFIVRAAVCSFLTWIGEAVAHITDETKNKRKEIDWANIKGIRNIITHEYFGIDYKLVHKAVINNIPPLKNAVEELLKDFE
ncbi:MAG: hypothetical protein JWQ30_1196 [Sediminibacterium sp.]|nr:hypothetical protein [Sediminibacterium sp.]